MFSWNKPKPNPTPAPFLPWTPELRIGVRQLDQEHQQMAALIDRMHALMVVERDRPAADRLIDELLQVTRAHFAHEEALMEECAYEDREAHFREHSNLIEELRDLQRQFKAGTLSSLATPTFMKKWMLEHIQHTDRRYVSCLKAKGIP